MSTSSSADGKTVGIVAYLWLVGWVIALILNNNDKTEFGGFHLRQALGIMILWIVIAVFNVILTIMDIPFIGWLLYIAIFVLWILGIIGAVQGEKKLIPGLGAQFQDWFKGIA